jgi:hypothetical protein
MFIMEKSIFPLYFLSQYVPYRYDPMTRLFKNYFEGEGKIRMIVCISPTAVEYDETVVSYILSSQAKIIIGPKMYFYITCEAFLLAIFSIN